MSSSIPSEKKRGYDEVPQSTATTEYCQKLQQWMWNYYWGYTSWQNWVALSTLPVPPVYDAHLSTTTQTTLQFDSRNWYNYPYPLSLAAGYPEDAQNAFYQTAASTDPRTGQQQNGTPPQPGIFFNFFIVLLIDVYVFPS